MSDKRPTWSAGEPFTLYARDHREQLACPVVSRLPCGDIVVGYTPDGDFTFGLGSLLRSSDGGATWKSEEPPCDGFVHTSLPLVLGKGVVRGYGECMALRPPSPEEICPLPVEWRFRKDPEDRGLSAHWAKAPFDDAWQRIRTDEAWTEQEAGEGYHGAAWYGLEFTLPPADRAALARMEQGYYPGIHFGAVDGVADIFLDGMKIGEQKASPERMWDKAFVIPLPEDFDPSATHRLVVRVQKDEAAAGIWKPVRLVGAPRETATKSMFFYRDSVDGGRTFGESKVGHAETPTRNFSGSIGTAIGGKCALIHRIVHRRDLLEAAGWEQKDWRRAPVPWYLMTDKALVELDDGTLLTFISGRRAADAKGDSLLAYRSTDGGVTWVYYSTVALYETKNPERGYYEGFATTLNDGRIYVVMRAGGGGLPLMQTWSSDQGRTWTPVRPIHPHVTGITPRLVRLSDGSLALAHGRPGLFLMFDPTGTGEGWDVEGRIDLTCGEELTIQTNAKPFLARIDIWEEYMHSIKVPKENLPWFRRDILDGEFYSWENVDLYEVEPGKILYVYDLQNWIEHHGAAPRKAIRGVWIQKQGNASGAERG